MREDRLGPELNVHLECWRDPEEERWYLLITPVPGVTVRIDLDLEVAKQLEVYNEIIPTIYFRDPGAPQRQTLHDIRPPVFPPQVPRENTPPGGKNINNPPGIAPTTYISVRPGDRIFDRVPSVIPLSHGEEDQHKELEKVRTAVGKNLASRLAPVSGTDRGPRGI